MEIVERRVSAGDREIFDLDEFLRGRCMLIWRTSRKTDRGIRRSGFTGMVKCSGSSVESRFRRISAGSRDARSASWTLTSRRGEASMLGCEDEQSCGRLILMLRG